jgi:peptide/nickel transport system permease protein
VSRDNGNWGTEGREARSLWGDAWRRLKQDRAASAGMVVLSLLVTAAIFAPLLIPHSPTKCYNEGLSDFGEPMPPSVRFLLGTDHLGRDVLSRLIQGARISLFIGIASNLLAILIAVPVGSIAAYAGGWVEVVLMRLTDVVMSFPMLLLAIALAAVMRPGLETVIVVIAFVYWSYLARIIYGKVLSLKTMDFITAARAVGAAPARILSFHILPNVVSECLVYATLGVAQTVLTEASMSYLGVGVRLPTPSWGGMIAEGQTYYRAAPWMILYPGLALVLTVLAFNLLGDGLRDALDPRSRG